MTVFFLSMERRVGKGETKGSRERDENQAETRAQCGVARRAGTGSKPPA